MRRRWDETGLLSGTLVTILRLLGQDMANTSLDNVLLHILHPLSMSRQAEWAASQYGQYLTTIKWPSVVLAVNLQPDDDSSGTFPMLWQ
ncbi:MAG TPA: hypothetical protein VFV38_30820 [Ktedonobacteraceae bacterium]|nr:hypothetical protein [Ktedonobacteraceae bacterium]